MSLMRGGRGRTGAVTTTVLPKLPSRSFMAWASRCTSAGWPGPAATRALPSFPFKSLATASTQRPASPSAPHPLGRGPPRRGGARRGDGAPLGGRRRGAVVGGPAGDGEARLDGVQPVHALLVAPARGPLVRVGQAPRGTAEQVGAQRHD